MSEIISVGIDIEDKTYLRLRGFSPTRVLRTAISNLRDETPQLKQELEDQIKRLKEHSNRLLKFIQDKGLIDEFISPK